MLKALGWLLATAIFCCHPLGVVWAVLMVAGSCVVWLLLMGESLDEHEHEKGEADGDDTNDS